MTTINDIADVVRIVEDNPEWRSELRRVLLTQELLEVPERIDNIDARIAALLESHEAANKRMESIDEQIAELVKNSVEANKRMDAMSTRMDGMDSKLNRIDGNVGDLKGHITGMSARDSAAVIAMEMGLQWQRTMETSEIVPIWQAAQRARLTEGISRDDRRSFLDVDLVFEALDADDELRYISVEASYTADERETDRAIRNAGYFTRFTGVPTYAVAASIYADNRILHILNEDVAHPHGQMEEQQVFWFKLPEPDRPR